MLRLDLTNTNLKKYDGPIAIAIDSSGVHKCGWIERIYGRRRRYVKIHFAVDVRTREVVSMDVATDDVHDSEVLPRLIIDTSMNRLIAEAYRMEHTTHQTPTPYLDGCKANN